MRLVEPKDGRLVPPDVGRDELNLAQFPIHQLCAATSEKVPSLTFRGTVVDGGQTREVTWRVKASIDHGIPTAIENDVLEALQRLTLEQDSPKTIHFSLYELLEKLEWPHNGQHYRRAVEALDRLLSTTIQTDAFWDHSAGVYLTIGFQILQFVKVVRMPGRRHATKDTQYLSSVMWSDTIYNSLKSGYVKTTDYALYVDLKTPTARRLYQVLDLELRKTPSAKFDLLNLAHERVGLSRSYKYPSKCYEKLRPAIIELEQHAYLERGATKVDGAEITFVRGSRPTPEVPGAPSFPVIDADIPAGPDRDALVRELVQRGLDRKKAQSYVSTASAEELALLPKHFSHFDHALARGAKMKSRGAYLMAMIRGNWDAPAEIRPAQEASDAEPSQQALFGEEGSADMEWAAYNSWADEQAIAAFDALPMEEREARTQAQTTRCARENAAHWKRMPEAARRSTGEYEARKALRAELNLPTQEKWAAERRKRTARRP